MKPKFAVIGLGRFGLRLAETLTQSGAEVLAIDRDREIIDSVRDKVTMAVRLDSTDENALRLQGVDQVAVAVCGIGDDFESAILTVSILKSFGVPRIICRAENDRRGRILVQVGADSIVNPGAESAVRWSHRLLLPDLADYVELGEGHSLVQVPTPVVFQNKTPAELQLRQKYNVTLVAVKRAAVTDGSAKEGEDFQETILIPEPSTRLTPNDLLVLIGSNESINELLCD